MNRFTILCFGLVFLLGPRYASAEASEKKLIASIDDLPRHTYKISGSLTELITNEKSFAQFASEVRANVENDLKTYDINDKTTLKKYYGLLITLDILEEEYDRALANIARVRELEDKSVDKLTLKLIDEAIVRAEMDIRKEHVFAQYLVQSVEQLPWKLVQDRIEAIKGDLDLFSKNMLLGMIQSQYEPGVEKTHQIGDDIAFEVIDLYYLMEVVLPRKESINEVLGKYIAANRLEKQDIWKARQVDLSQIPDLNPITIAIWDTGVDTSVFPDQFFVNHKEKVNNRDDDGNGYVDDVHGIGYTIDPEKTREILYPIENPESINERKDLIKALSDIEAAIASPEAAALKQRLAAMSPEEVKPFIEQLVQFAIYMHGTYTAGLAVETNPYARILVARLTDDYRMVPLPWTIEKSKKWAEMFRDVIGYFKTNGVRVVNMSWTAKLKTFENNLEVNAIGKDSRERARMAREMFDIGKESLFQAMKNAPDILFITSAGNKGDDVAFEDHYPSAFDLPNLLVVGAVDQAGYETSFTSFGGTVDVYANGFEVESYIPGGEKLPASGTSAASPIVANLAAKLLAVDPSSTPEEVIALIIAGADQNENGRLLINPKRSLELLRARQSG